MENANTADTPIENVAPVVKLEDLDLQLVHSRR
jgi:hypothetical protein